MSRNTNNSVALVVALLSLMLAPAMVACERTPPALDLTTVPACLTEDGPGLTGPVPCVFDVSTKTDTANGTGGERVRWYVYADACPVNTVQDRRLVECVGREDWTGGIGSGEGRTN